MRSGGLRIPAEPGPLAAHLLGEVHLERGKVYQTKVDVPHTVYNEHPTDGRLHLILDVAPPAR